jgi:hypothetical protein
MWASEDALSLEYASPQLTLRPVARSALGLYFAAYQDRKRNSQSEIRLLGCVLSGLESVRYGMSHGPPRLNRIPATAPTLPRHPVMLHLRRLTFRAADISHAPGDYDRSPEHSAVCPFGSAGFQGLYL